MLNHAMRLVLVLPLLLGAGLPSASAQQAQGERLAQELCAGCHAIGRTGASPREGAPPFRDLHRRYRVDDLAEALAEGIMTGHPEMPQFSFDTDQVTAFLDYLRSLER